MKFNSLIPELSVTNIEKSRMFYESLGFQIKYSRPKFYFLELEENQLMIEEMNDNWNVGKLEYPFGRGMNISMTVSNIDAFYKKVQEQKIKIFVALKVSEYVVDGITYQDKEFLIQDPDGYLLRFNNWRRNCFIAVV